MTNPWLKHPLNNNPDPAEEASFVEYLRWMRILRANPREIPQIGFENNGKILELLDKLLRNSNYSNRLIKLTARTQKLAELHFKAKANWRIRVGGMRGPESMLLPAFDALGMPYIPSTTLKGIAREIAEREVNNNKSPTTPELVRDIFGEIEPTACMGKVIFLDAYPLPFPQPNDESADERIGLVPDMANSIWTWDGNTPKYKTNPNIFLSLRKPTFVIGLRLANGADDTLLKHVKRWLFTGLAQGIGSRVNSGYGVLAVKPKEGEEKPKKQIPIVRVQFELRGQLPHGRQYFNNWQRPKTQAEVRPPAFRSMLRYWFRTLALGVLEPSAVQEWELNIFGGIEPKAKMGMFQLEILNGKIQLNNNRPERSGKATGTLVVRPSYQALRYEQQQKIAAQKLIKSLTWLMFHLGGVGQGARRPCHRRQNPERPNPYWRGASLFYGDNNLDWTSLESLDDVQENFESYLNSFYRSLRDLTQLEVKPNRPKTAPRTGEWAEAVDKKCRIICVKGNFTNTKPPALALLHQEANENGNDYDAQLCGSTKVRSPILISRVGSVFNDETGFGKKGFDVVTIFGIDNARRQSFYELLTTSEYPLTDYLEIWTPE
ncbi:MAG: RAMP superfamily CRISPR-associated protein [Cyanobacteria bacterium P01_H01_bin.150]